MLRHEDSVSPENVSSNPSQFFDIHGVLLHVAIKNYKPHYHPLFQQREYSLILRKACCEQNLELVELLMKYQDKLDIDMNGRSSNGNTALDWAIESHGSTETMKKLMSVLIAAGARTGSDLDEELVQGDVNSSGSVDLSDHSSESSEDETPVWPLRCNVL